MSPTAPVYRSRKEQEMQWVIGMDIHRAEGEVGRLLIVKLVGRPFAAPPNWPPATVIVPLAFDVQPPPLDAQV